MAEWTEIWASFVDTEAPAEVYAELNDPMHQKPLTSGNMVFSYLKNPKAVPERVRANFQGMVAVVGREIAQKVADEGYTYATYAQALEVASYCRRGDDQDFIRAALNWLMDQKQTDPARKMMECRAPASPLAKAVESNKPVCEC